MKQISPIIFISVSKKFKLITQREERVKETLVLKKTSLGNGCMDPGSHVYRLCLVCKYHIGKSIVFMHEKVAKNGVRACNFPGPRLASG